MPRRKVDLRKVFLPSDSIAFVVIALGLFIALFLDEMAVRLIGVCITVLGGVALFMMVSPRLADMSVSRGPRPSESPNIDSQVKRDPLKTSRVFDGKEFRDTFGVDEGAEEAPIDEKQIAIWEDIDESRKREQAKAAAKESARELIETASQTQRIKTEERVIAPLDIEVGDTISSVRILGTKSSSGSKEPALAISTRAANKDVVRSAQSTGPIPAGITGPITEEIQLSEDVIVRPKSSDSAGSSAALNSPTANSPAPERPLNINIKRTEPEPEIEETIPFEDAVPFEDAQRIPTPTDPPPQLPAKQKKSEISVSAFMADADDEMEQSEEPRKEFDYLLNRVLMVIRSATNARTAAFFWFNKEKQELVVEASISDETESFTTERKIPIGKDVVSQIALDGRPEILTDISPHAEVDLLPYYRYRAGTLSFVGVPVYYKNNVVGVLCADSKIEDAYSDVTVGFFGHFTKLISGLVSSYTTKYDLQQRARILEAYETFKSASQDSASSVGRVTAALTDTIIRIMEVSSIGFVLYDHARKAWTIPDVQSVLEEYSNLIGTTVNLDATEVGQCIKTGRVITASSSKVRLAPSEPRITGAQFVAFPLRSTQSTYGAMFLENNEGTMSAQDIVVAETLADHAGSLIEQIRGFERLQDSALLDYDTGILNLAGFEARMKEEFARSTDYQLPLSVCMIKIDPSRSTKESEASKVRGIVLAHVLKRIKEQIRDYDVIGRYSEDVIVVGLVAYTSHEAQYWTEGLRRDIASLPFDADGKRLTTTISAGIAQANPRDSWNSTMDHAETALDISAKQQNKVTVYS